MPPPRRYESLDAWRGVACLAVVVYHAGVEVLATGEVDARVRAGGGSWADWAAVGLARLWAGVPLFFVISGYCIAASADGGRVRAGGGWSFLARRVRRIYPPLWIYLGLTAAIAACVPSAGMPRNPADHPHQLHHPWDVSAEQWAGAVTLTEEWRPNLGGPPTGYVTGQVWSLCYEEQFYLVVGLVVLLAPRLLFPAVAVVTALIYLNTLNLGPDLGRYQLHARGFFFDGLWLAFAAGVGVYYRGQHATPVMRRCLDGLVIAALVGAARAVPSAWDLRENVNGYLIVGLAFALLLGWLRRFDATLAGARVLAPVAWCGRMCYSLYLVHAPVTALIAWNHYRAGLTDMAGTLLVTVPLSVGVSIPLAYAFHRTVERRFQNAPSAAAGQNRRFSPFSRRTVSLISASSAASSSAR